MSKEIVLVSGLPHTPGWVALSQQEKEWLQEHTSNAVDNFRQSGLKALQSCAEMAMIEDFLNNKPMTMTNWIQTCFGSSERTAWRWLARYKDMRGQVPDDAILYLAREGVAGVASIQTGDVVNVVKRLPPPKGTSEKALKAWKDEIAEELRTERSGRSKGKKRKLDPEDAAKIGAVTVHRLLRDAKIDTTRDAKDWLKKWLGYVMDRRAIAGAVQIERTPVPEGWWPQVGRPRKTTKTSRIAASMVLASGTLGYGAWWAYQNVERMVTLAVN